MLRVCEELGTRGEGLGDSIKLHKDRTEEATASISVSKSILIKPGCASAAQSNLVDQKNII